jgi:hypothetical protein
MHNNPSEIVRAYFRAQSLGDQEGLAQLLSDDFKEIDTQLGTLDKQAFLGALRLKYGNAPGNIPTILDMRAVGNVVRVKCQNGAVVPQTQYRVIALAEGKIKLDVQVAPDSNEDV